MSRISVLPRPASIIHPMATISFIAFHSIAPLLQWVRLARWPETAENGAVFLRALMKGKELHVLKPLNLNRFRVSFPGKIASVWLYCGIRGRQNEPPGLEFRPEAKDSGAVKIISISCDRLWPASASCANMESRFLSCDHSCEPP